jgi:hypothetical protein
VVSSEEAPSAAQAPSGPPHQPPPGSLGRLVAWLERHPIAKLAAYLWLVASAGGSVFGAYRQFYVAPREEAARASEDAARKGADRAPLVRFRFSWGDQKCTLFNIDKFPLEEVTIGFHRHLVRVNGGCNTDSAQQQPEAPGAGAHTLRPREKLEATPSPDAWKYLDHFQDIDHCPTATDKCVRILECRAQYHREADLKPYGLSGFVAFLPGGKTADVRSLSLYGMGELQMCFDRMRKTWPEYSWVPLRMTPAEEGQWEVRTPPSDDAHP